MEQGQAHTPGEPGISRVRALLLSRRLPFLVGGVAAALALPSLGVGWVADDWWHRVVLKGSPILAEYGILPSGSIMELFRFLDGDPVRTGRLMELGLLPWWTDPHIFGAFLRPITALTHWIDYRCWPDQAWLMHLHSVAWLATLAIVVTCLYRRTMGVTVAAGLAALCYAIDDARAMPVGFLANRNALVSGVFGVLALIAHDRWRRGGAPPISESRCIGIRGRGRPGSDRGGGLNAAPAKNRGDRRFWNAIAAPALLTLSLFSAEAGVGILGYLAAHALFLDRAAGWRKGAALVPHALVVVVWRVVWRTLGYGVSPNMEFYVDPLAEPLRFMGNVIERAPLLMWGQWITLSDASLVVPRPWLWLFWALALTLVGWLAWRLGPLLRHHAVARFWAAGMMIALVPACTTIPNDRMLTYVGLGAFGLLGAYLSPVSAGVNPAARVGRGMRRLLVALHLLIAPLALAVRSANPTGPRFLMERFQTVVPPSLPIEGRELVILNPPFAMAVGFATVIRVEAGLPAPRRIRTLGASFQTLEVDRPDERTLVIRPEGGYLLNPFDQIFRGARTPLRLGERIELGGLSVEVTRLTPDGRPAEALFRFEHSLDDARYAWVRWEGWAYVLCMPPPIGSSRAAP